MADGIASSTAANNADGGAVVNRGKRRGLGLQFWIPACFLAALLFVAITAPWIGIKDPYEGDFINLQVRPNEEFLFGTDVLGRDILARMVYGARISLTVGFAAPGIGLAFGLVIGLMAGYFRGWVDEVIVIAIDTWLAIPGLVIMLEVFPNVIWPVIAYILVAIPIAIVVEGALSFLGLSVPSPNPSWGGMIAEGREHIEETPHITLIPMAIMFLTVLSFNLAGDVVRRRMADVREASI
ncbi:MAG: ABC transporter permease [Alphaproteobacteria bacterium]